MVLVWPKSAYLLLSCNIRCYWGQNLLGVDKYNIFSLDIHYSPAACI